jgi:hypothetical protein
LALLPAADAARPLAPRLARASEAVRQAASKSQQIKLPSETVLNFTLQAPVTIIKPTGSDAPRPKLGNS